MDIFCINLPYKEEKIKDFFGFMTKSNYFCTSLQMDNIKPQALC